MHRIYWAREGPPGRAEWYAATRSVPAWLCGWGLRGFALCRAVTLAAREPHAGAGWVLPEGCRATPVGEGV